MRVLVVEDEKRLAQALGQILSQNHYLTDVVNNGSDGLDYALSGRYELIILDIMLPGKNGFEIVRAMRQASVPTPVLMLTAREEISDKVRGLDSGADDYMTKPFETDELLARVRALLRRKSELNPETIIFGDTSLNTSTHELMRENKTVHLSYKEFEVMHQLIAHPGIIISKNDLISRIWGDTSDAEDNNVEAYISFLRKKLEYLNSGISVETVRKVGYRLCKTSVRDVGN